MASVVLALVGAMGCKDGSSLDSGTADELEIPAGMTLGEVVPCQAPLPAVQYREVGAERGLTGSTQPDGSHKLGGGLAVEDFDGDGAFDVVLAYVEQPPVLYLRDGDAYSPQVLAAPSVAQTLGVADVDGDGDPDLLATGRAVAPVILLNDGGQLSPVALEYGDYGVDVRDLSPGDADGDGIIDLYATAHGTDAYDAADALFLGAGDGTFELASLDPDHSFGRGFDALWLDYDDDGDLDVYVANDDGSTREPNVMWANEGGVLVPAMDCFCELAHDGMGIDVADADGDGRPDLYVAADLANVLLLASDAGYVDVTAATGANPIPSTHMGWAGVWLDHDNDGLLDLLATDGDNWRASDENLDELVWEAAVHLLAGSDDGFREVGPALGLPQTGSWRSAVAWDDNGDGVLDLLLSDVLERPQLFLSEGCTAEAWLEVRAPPSSRVQVEADGVIQTRWIHTDSSYGAGGPPLVHFGLGGATQVDRVTVRHIDGSETELLGPVDARRVVTVQ